MIKEIDKCLIKKTCKACGHKVICKRIKPRTPSPENCACCRSLGVEKARLELLNLKYKKSRKGEFLANDKLMKGGKTK
jgi:hypothetical protein